METVTPTYLDNVYVGDVWSSNWFVSLKGGVSAFVGNPVGHGDFFDRTKGMLNVSIGKWFSPYIGGRIAFQGLKLLDANIVEHKYQNVHADFLYNVATHFHNNFEEAAKWDVILQAGCGIIRHGDNGHKPFAISYGLQARYRLMKRLHVAAEVAATTTFQDFDGEGAGNKFGDHLLQGSIGLDVTLGKVGWKRVIDPKPYIFQNDILMERISKMRDENEKLNKKHQKDVMSLAEMRKILEIEGLLDKYNLYDEENVEQTAKLKNAKNNYSGLNSLRNRIRNRRQGTAEPKDHLEGVLEGEPENIEEMNPDEYLKVMKDGKIFVGSPIFFFFNIGTDELSEKAQIINIKEVASVIRKYGLNARIVGAADSQTGTAYGNERLSAKRADFIAQQLREQGVSDEKMSVQYRGGINMYEPQTGNRNTCVMLYFKEK